MSEILDNQEVTSDTLNNIAVDLGSTDFSAFDSSPFGVDKLNQITADLVTAGVLMSGNKCNMTASDGEVYIDTGVIVFNSGAKIRITEVQTVDLIANTYIYALNNTVSNTAEIVVSDTEPVDGDFVMLAAVDGDGALTDKRGFAMSKTLPIYVTDEEGNEVEATVLPTPQNYYVEKTVTLNFDSINFAEACAIDIGWSGWNYVFLKGMSSDKYFSPVPGTISPGYNSLFAIKVEKDGNTAKLSTRTNSSTGTSTVTLVFM